MKLKRIKNNPAHWPPEKQVAEMRKKLSSSKVMGSTILDRNASLVDRFKYSLCGKVVSYSLDHDLNQKEIGKLLGIDAPEANRLLHYKIERYTIDRLVRYVEILYPKLTLEAIVA